MSWPSSLDSGSSTSIPKRLSHRCSTTDLCWFSHRSVEETARSIAQFSVADAEAYRRFSDMAIRIFPMLAGALFAPPVPMGAMISMMSQSAEGNELLLMSLKKRPRNHQRMVSDMKRFGCIS